MAGRAAVNILGADIPAAGMPADIPAADIPAASTVAELADSDCWRKTVPVVVVPAPIGPVLLETGPRRKAGTE